jgi:hypothetical protein
MTIALFAVILIAAPSLAQLPQPEPTALIRDVAPFVDAQTLAIAHFDLARLDPQQFATQMRETIEGDPQLSSLNFLLEGFEQPQWAEIQATRQSILSRGHRHLYLLINMADFLTFDPLVWVMPGSESVADLIPAAQAHEVIGGAIVFANPGVLMRIKTMTPSPRPDIETALQAVQSHDAQFLLLPTEDIRRILAEILPTLPDDVGGGPSTALTEGIVWAAAGASVMPKLNASVVIQSRDATSAAELQAFLERGRMLMMKEIAKPAEVVPPSLVQATQGLMPQPQGDQLTLTLGRADLEKLLVGLAPLLERGRENARLVVTMQHTRQIATALCAYAQDHSGQFPPSLQDITPYLGASADVVLQNPRDPQRQIGFVYLPPTEPLEKIQAPAQLLLLYEAFDEWPQSGIVVGFADTHVQTITDRATFDAMLAQRQ